MYQVLLRNQNDDKKIGTLGTQGKSLETLPAITLNFFVRVQTCLRIGFQSQYANLSGLKSLAT